MFSRRFDALMNIAEVSNSLLGRDVNINPSHIGRLRSGARPLPKKHDFLPAICRYLASHIKKDYQFTALQKLTGITEENLTSAEKIAAYLETWLLTETDNFSATAERLVYGFSQLAQNPLPNREAEPTAVKPLQNDAYLYGNEGKRRSVEQFFQAVLQASKPQTLLLFSDENMAWLYEDPAFTARWANLFQQVIAKGNTVKIIHTVTRDLNELLEAVTKWIPIYLTGRIEPYCYSRLRDGIFRRTLFIAPDTAAVISSSIQENTAEMLNLYITESQAIRALITEYQNYYALCRPLMRIFNSQKGKEFYREFEAIALTSGNTYLSCALPPLFAMGKELITELATEYQNETLLPLWERLNKLYHKNIKEQRLTVTILEEEAALTLPEALEFPFWELYAERKITLTSEQCRKFYKSFQELAAKEPNLEIHYRKNIPLHTFFYAKEESGTIITKTDAPMAAFIISEPNIVNALWDYLRKG